MGPGFYMIAILGCADGAAQCAPVATLPTRYESRAACEAATAGALDQALDFDFPTLTAQCRGAKAPAAQRNDTKPPRSPIAQG